MPKYYLYEAFDENHKITKGKYEASSDEEVIRYLTKRSLTPLSIKAFSSGDSITKSNSFLSLQLFNKISSVDILFFIRNLGIALKAGLPIVEALDILIKDTKNKLMKKILIGVSDMVKNGQPLSAGFEEYKNLFPTVFVGMIKAGEVSGNLDDSLFELSRYLSKEYSLQNKIKSALTYPIILLVSSTVVVILMLIFVLPKLTASFISSGVALPLITKIFLLISKILTWSYILDILVVLIIVWFFSYFRTTKTGKKFFLYVISRTPVASELVKKIALVRFSRTFGHLIGSGLSASESLEIAAQSANNFDYTVAIESTISDIESGVTISESLGKNPNLFPILLISLISVGERTGSLQEILLSFSDFYDEEVDNKLKELTAILEPALLLIMGLMIGAIALSIILPIYQLVGHFV